MVCQCSMTECVYIYLYWAVFVLGIVCLFLWLSALLCSVVLSSQCVCDTEVSECLEMRWGDVTLQPMGGIFSRSKRTTKDKILYNYMFTVFLSVCLCWCDIHSPDSLLGTPHVHENGSLLQKVSHVAVVCYIKQASRHSVTVRMNFRMGKKEWPKRLLAWHDHLCQAHRIQYLRNLLGFTRTTVPRLFFSRIVWQTKNILSVAVLWVETNRWWKIEGEWQVPFKLTGGTQTDR